MGSRLAGSARKPGLDGASVTESWFDPPDEGQRIDWRRLFGNERPVELEIGCGKGAFLVTAAETYADVNFVGVEIVRTFALAAADRMARRGLTNVRLTSMDAAMLVRDHVPPGSLAAVHVYFPDPWPKKRHRKRRLVKPEFLDAVGRALEPNGWICLATDFAEYYADMRAAADSDSRFRRELDFVWSGAAESGVTNFERKYLAEGRKVYRASYRSCSSTSP